MTYSITYDRALHIGLSLGHYQNLMSIIFCAGVFGVMYEGYLTNTEDDVEGATPVIIKTVKGNLSNTCTT